MVRADHLDTFGPRRMYGGEVIFGMHQVAGRAVIEVSRANVPPYRASRAQQQAAALAGRVLPCVREHVANHGPGNRHLMADRIDLAGQQDVAPPVGRFEHPIDRGPRFEIGAHLLEDRRPASPGQAPISSALVAQTSFQMSDWARRKPGRIL